MGDSDAYGRDQDYSFNEHYDDTRAKSYGAESYDEWDNTDDDTWGALAWGRDQDKHGHGAYGYGAHQSTPSSHGHGWGKGGHGGWGHGGSSAQQYGNKGYGAQYGAKNYGAAKGASGEWKAAKGGYDNDAWAKGAYGTDHDSRYGKSYDAVHAKSHNEQNYLRHTQADDDRWAVDEDTGFDYDEYGYGNDASAQSYRAPQAWGRTYTAPEPKHHHW